MQAFYPVVLVNARLIPGLVHKEKDPTAANTMESAPFGNWSPSGGNHRRDPSLCRQKSTGSAPIWFLISRVAAANKLRFDG